jgi:hypothetical protein
MAKKENELFERLTAAGVRKKVARKVSRAAENGGVKASGKVASLLEELHSVVAEAHDLATGGPAKRSAAARKAAATRRRNQAARSAAAPKAAGTPKATGARRRTAASR